MQDLLGRARTPAEDLVDGLPAAYAPARLSPSPFFYRGDELLSGVVGEEQRVLDELRKLCLGAREAAENAQEIAEPEITTRVVAHDGRGSALEKRIMSHGCIVIQRFARAQAEVLVVQRMVELVGESDLEQRPARLLVPDDHQSLRAFVVEAQDFLPLGRAQHFLEVRRGRKKPDELELLFVHLRAATRVAGPSL